MNTDTAGRIARCMALPVVAAGIIGGAALGLAGTANAAEGTWSHHPESHTGIVAEPKTKVLIEGQDQNIQGPVACTTTGDTVNIAIGDATRGIGAVLSTTEPPEVRSVGLGNVGGVTLGYSQDQAVPEGVNWSEAEATKDGNTYKIIGTAMGIDTANPTQPVYSKFEINVTCP